MELSLWDTAGAWALLHLRCITTTHCELIASLPLFLSSPFAQYGLRCSPTFPQIGQEEFDRLRSLSYAETHVIMICFSVDNPVSLENVESKVLRYHFYSWDVSDEPISVAR